MDCVPVVEKLRKVLLLKRNKSIQVTINNQVESEETMAEYRVTIKGTLVVDANTLEEAEDKAFKCLVEEMIHYEVTDNIRSDGDYSNEE